MHEETYPAFFTPRDEEPSRSSSEEKSSKFDWLERKITRKKIYIRKTEQVVYKIYFLLYSRLHDAFLYIGSKIYIEKIFSKKYPNNMFD